MSGPITFPPTIWLSFVVMLEMWVQQNFPFPDYWWSPGIVIALGAIVKGAEIYTKDKGKESSRGYLWTSRSWRFFVGGE